MRQALLTLLVTIISSVILIIMGIVYFAATLWIIKAAAGFIFETELNANWAVLSAAILATGAIVAGAIERKPRRF